jgi:hypothetical protein
MLSRLFFCKQRTLGCNPISNTIALEDITYYFVGTGYPRGFFQLGMFVSGSGAHSVIGFTRPGDCTSFWYWA